MRLAFTHPLHLVTGLAIWALWFVGVYGGLSLGCMISQMPQVLEAGSWINMTLLAFTLLVVVLLFTLAIKCWRGASPGMPKLPKFIRRVAGALYVAAAIAVMAVGLPMLVLPPCL